jgi:hypothetical protein
VDSPGFVEEQVSVVRRWLFHKAHIVKFFGRDRWDRVCGGDSSPWGWKDPRTTITFPIWTDVFPGARFVHVVRNGVDVAISLHRRALSHSRHWRKRFSRLHSPAALDFQYCFHLWEKYVSFVLNHKHAFLAHRYLELRYEDLLLEPQVHLQRLVAFLSYPVDDGVLAATCRQVDSSRLDNLHYAADYQDEIPAVVSSSVMQRLGYNYAIP